MTTYRLPGRYLPPRRFRYPYRRRGGNFGPWAGAGLILLAAAGGTHGKIVAPLIRHAAPPALQSAAAGASGASQLSTASANVALGQQLAAADGWNTGPQWGCLDALWTRESGWRMVWNYQGSGAYGIPQSLPASKMSQFGADYMTNPATQIRWGLWYIGQTYVDPCGAWAHETSAGWY